MEGVDAVGRLEVAGGNIDGAVGDNGLRAKYGAEWFAVWIGERAEEGAERSLELHQLAAISNVVDDAVGDGQISYGFIRLFSSPEKRAVLPLKGPSTELLVLDMFVKSSFVNGWST